MPAELTTEEVTPTPTPTETIPETPFYGAATWRPEPDAGGSVMPHPPLFLRTRDNYETRDEAAKAARTLFLQATSTNVLHDARILVCEEIAL
jgi:hypothetical protein